MLRKKQIVKPNELIVFEQCRDMRVPLVDGGLLDQPYIWAEQYAAIKNLLQIHEQSQNAQVPPGGK